MNEQLFYSCCKKCDKIEVARNDVSNKCTKIFKTFICQGVAEQMKTLFEFGFDKCLIAEKHNNVPMKYNKYFKAPSNCPYLLEMSLEKK